MKAKIFYVAMALVIALMTGFVAAAPGVGAAGEVLVDFIDFGNPTSEGGIFTPPHILDNWGPIEPDASGGDWGGIATDPASPDKKCRAVWSPGDTPQPVANWATFMLDTGAGMDATTLKLRVLDGSADDSFVVYVADNLVFTYTDEYPPDDPEVWQIHNIDISGVGRWFMVRIHCTGPKWYDWDTYGQLGVDWAELYAEESVLEGGCFIATAAYGTPAAEQLDVLRAFRDQVLLESTLGAQFVAWYYQVSPPVAEFISDNNLLRSVVRELLIDPVVNLAKFTQGIWGD